MNQSFSSTAYSKDKKIERACSFQSFKSPTAFLNVLEIYIENFSNYVSRFDVKNNFEWNLRGREE